MNTLLYTLIVLLLLMPTAAQNDDDPIRFGVGVELLDPRIMNAIIDDFADANNVALVWEGGVGAGFDCGTTDGYAPSPDSQTLDLTPLINADPDFDPADYIPTVLDQATTDDGMFGLPLALLPQAIWLSMDIFMEENVPIPAHNWTLDDFISTINAFEPDTVVIGQPGNDFAHNRPILLLAGLLGGLPLDYRTTPPTPNFTEPQTIEALRQVTGLVLQGGMSYDPLFTLDWLTPPTTDRMPLMVDSVGLFSARPIPGGWSGYRPFPYPTGDGPTVVSYSTINGYISAQTDHADTCYRLLRHLSADPNVFFSPPVRLSVLEDPDYRDSYGGWLIGYTSAFAQKLANADEVIVIPAYSMVFDDGELWSNLWLNRVLDRTISGADLEAGLTEAQGLVQALYACDDDVMTCAQAIDPDGHAALFGTPE